MLKGFLLKIVQKHIFIKDRLLHAAILGKVIFETVVSEKMNLKPETGLMTTPVESYLFLLRRCYDFSPQAIARSKNGDTKKDWRGTIEKIEKGKLPLLKKTR